jgi:hypothetical protein
MRGVLLALILLAAAGPSAAQDADTFEAACSFGDFAACNVLGLMYETGAGVDQDLQRASAIYGRLCDAGDSAGCTALGLLMAHGFGMPKDRLGAASLYRTACEAADEFGCDLLAALEWEGPITAPQSFFKWGRVLDARSGALLAGALVRVPRLGIQGLTDAQGRVSLGRVEEGYHELRVDAVGYEPVIGTVIVPGYSEFFVLLDPMDRGPPAAAGEIAGLVADALGQAMSDVEVRVAGHEGLRTLTDPMGYFFLGDVPIGLATLEFSRVGYATRETMLIVQSGARARVDAVLSP